MTRDEVQLWLDSYIEAWKTYDPAVIGDLLSADVRYRHQPYREPGVGRDALVADWLEDPDESGPWDASYAPYAVDGDRAVAVGESRYFETDGSLRTAFYNCWLLRFDPDGRCAEFVEYSRELPEELRPGR